MELLPTTDIFSDLCKNPPCGVTNIRLEMTTEIPSYQKRVDIESIFRWKPSSTCMYVHMINMTNGCFSLNMSI